MRKHTNTYNVINNVRKYLQAHKRMCLTMMDVTFKHSRLIINRRQRYHENSYINNDEIDQNQQDAKCF